MLIAGIKYFFVGIVTDLVRWPVWWYSRGFILVSSWILQSIRNYGRGLALGVWIKNIFVPMFGTRDIQSRLISFMMRSVQIVARGFMLIVYSILMLILLTVYITIPIFAVLGIVAQFATDFD